MNVIPQLMNNANAKWNIIKLIKSFVMESTSALIHISMYITIIWNYAADKQLDNISHWGHMLKCQYQSQQTLKSQCADKNFGINKTKLKNYIIFLSHTIWSRDLYSLSSNIDIIHVPPRRTACLATETYDNPHIDIWICKRINITSLA